MLLTGDREGSPSDHVSPRVAWLSIFSFWLFYYVINTIHTAVKSEPGQLRMLGLRAIVTLSGAGLTWLLQLLLRRIDNRSMNTMVATAFLAALPLAIAYASVNFVAFYELVPTPADTEELSKVPGGAMSIIIGTALNWYFFVAAWAALYIALTYAVKVRQAERSAAGYRAAAQTAQLRALRYQVNPHFLFNTLNSLSTLVLKGCNAEAERMIMNLSTFFRSSLATELDDEISLSEEICMQRLYLDIEQVRFPERLRVIIDAAPEADAASVPAMLLQPVVENAIKHGVARSAKPVTLTIKAYLENPNTLCITVEDDAIASGDGLEAPVSSGQVGLRNVCARLEGRYGDASSCHYGSRPNGGFEVILKMPFSRHG